MLEGMAVASGPRAVIAAAIANGSNTSGALDIGARTLARIDFPAAFDGTSVSFLVSTAIDGTYVPLYKDDGTQYAPTIAQGHGVALDLSTMASARFLKIVAGTQQTGDRALNLVALA